MKTRFSSTTPEAPIGYVNGQFAEVVENGVRKIAVHVPDSGGGSGSPIDSGNGPVVFLGEYALSGGSVDITNLGDSDYKEIHLSIIGAKFNTDNVQLYLRVITAGGVQSGNNYEWGNLRWTGTGSTGATASNALDSEIELADSIGNSTNESVSGTVKCFDPHSSEYKRFISQLQYTTFNPQMFGLVGQGVWEQTTDLTGLRLLPSSGNFAGGVVRVYGIRS